MQSDTKLGCILTISIWHSVLRIKIKRDLLVVAVAPELRLKSKAQPLACLGEIMRSTYSKTLWFQSTSKRTLYLPYSSQGFVQTFTDLFIIYTR